MLIIMSEHLDLKNIMEVEQIRKILLPHPDLLALFEIVIIIANDRVNDEKPSVSLPIESYTEPDLSDHSSDEDA
tara:strand:+ start:421 stop:642 length:222 start_codon:yes stop_codon:yes gene_type:complete